MIEQPLAVTLLGSFDATLGKQPVPFRTDKIRALFAYLLLEAEQPHRRDVLSTLLWPDSSSSSARKNLRLSFFRMRQAIDKKATNPLADVLFQTSKKTIQFSYHSQIDVDVLTFRKLFADVQQHGHQDVRLCSICRENLQTAVSLYRGDLLSGFNLDDAEPFMEWLIVTREHLHQQALTAYDTLLENLQQYAHDATLRYARRLLQLEPWRESAHRTIMRTLAALDQRTAALDQFEKCRLVLWEELGVEPEPETVRLFEAIKAGELTSEKAGLAAERITEHKRPPPTNLDAPLTPFFGREQETAALLRLLTDQNHRLVTLVGGGGMGKSRLSQEVGRQLFSQFLDGIWFVPLVSIEGGEDKTADLLEEALTNAIADALGLKFSGTGDPQSQLLAYLRDKQLLLILDNFEHILDGADLLVKLLRGAEKLVLLTSSREPLNLMAETVYPLEGLLTEGEKAPTRQLFVDRAQRTNARFTPTSENSPLIAQLCRLLAGGPLAIELAAAALRRQSLSAIIASVQQSLDELTSRRRDLPPRHRSLRAVFNSSWELLPPDEQAGLARLSVFRGRFDPKAAQVIANASPWLLETLQEKSLLRQTADSSYELHELLRQFAAEERRALALPDDLRERHSRYYLRWLAKLEEPLQGKTPQTPAAAIQKAWDNVLQAWRVAVRQKNYQLLGRAVYSLSHFLQLNGRYRQAVRLFSEAAQSIDTPNLSAKHRQTLGRIETQLGRNLVRLARYDEAIQVAARAEHQATQAADVWGETMSQLVQADALWRQGKLDEARTLLEPLIDEEGKTAEFPRLKGIALQYLGIISDLSENYSQANIHLQAALRIWQEKVDKQREAITVNSLGVVHIGQEDYQQAHAYFLQVERLNQELGDIHSQLHVLNNLGLVAIYQNQFEAAKAHLEKAIALAQNHGESNIEAFALANRGWAAHKQGDPKTAAKYYGRSLNLFQRQGNQQGVGLVQSRQAELNIEAKKP